MIEFDDILDDAQFESFGEWALYDEVHGCQAILEHNVETYDELGNMNIVRRMITLDVRQVDPESGKCVEFEDGMIYELGRFIDRSGNQRRYEAI